MSLPLELWTAWTWVVLLMLSAFVLMFFPLAVSQALLLLRWVTSPSRKTHGLPVPGRRVAVVVCTNGKATGVVEHLLTTIRGYGVPNVELYVIKEAADPFRYSAVEMTVPSGYRTKNGSWTKERALQYGAEWGKQHGWGTETYVVHLDDDSLVDRGYLEHVMRMPEEAGQGALKLRSHGKHLMSTLADMVRISDCETWCRLFNERGTPKAVHGEGLALRADVEQEIGWDYATYCGEDFLMGQELVSRGYGFEHIPHDIFIAPPVNMRDFLKQRRRWTWGIFSTWGLMTALNKTTLTWVLYRYSVGWTGFVGFFLFLYSIAVHLPLPSWLAFVATFNLVVYFAYYQVAAAHIDYRYMPLMALLQFPVAMYEGMALPYSLLYPPDPHSFDTVVKV